MWILRFHLGSYSHIDLHSVSKEDDNFMSIFFLFRTKELNYFFFAAILMLV